MQISISTSTLYYFPFDVALDIIKEAGFKNIELSIYWKGGNWEISQHLKDIKPVRVLYFIKKSSLPFMILFWFLTFHTQITYGDYWCKGYQKIFLNDLNYVNPAKVYIENLPKFENYYSSLLYPEDLFKFRFYSLCWTWS